VSGYLSPDETRILGLNVQRLAQERNWSREDLARIAGMNSSTIRKMARARHSAQEGTLYKLAAALDIPEPHVLLLPYDPPPAPPTPTEIPGRPAQPPEPVRAARDAFNREVDELKRIAARTSRDDPAAGQRLYLQLTARIRQLAQAVQAERRKGRGT
jgi:transcriptional regulator with XRE-family HTH domain